MFYMHDIGWTWWVLLSIGVIVLWAAVAYAIVSFARLRAAERADDHPSETAEEILRRRLAEGELSIEEYERLHATLQRHAHTPGSCLTGVDDSDLRKRPLS